MRLLGTAVVLLAGAALSACEGTPPVTSPPVAETKLDDIDDDDDGDEAASDLRQHHRHHHLGGVTRFVTMSLDSMGIDDDKRPPVERVQRELRVCTASARAADNALLNVVGDGIAAGKINAAKVDAAIIELGTASAAAQDCGFAAMNQLHAILSPGEREALSDKVQAHWEVWRQVNHEGDLGGHEPGSQLADLSEDLDLTSEQVGKMSKAVAAASVDAAAKFDAKVAQAHVEGLTTAFSASSFDAKSVSMNSNGLLASRGGARMALFYQSVTPFLKATQRAELAEDVREHANHLQPTASAQ